MATVATAAAAGCGTSGALALVEVSDGELDEESDPAL
jgi:hypothetical protein